MMQNPYEGRSPQPGSAHAPSPDSSGAHGLRTSCDLCKTMKVKCERQGASCARCLGRRIECNTTVAPSKTKRKPEVVSKGKSLVDIESRIARIESAMLKAAQTDDGPTPERIKSQAGLVDQLSSLVINSEGTSQFLGASSAFSLFSPQGLKWISERTRSNDLPQLIIRMLSSDESNRTRSQKDLWHPRPLHERQPFPIKEVADNYVECYFTCFNCVFPLYERPVFFQLYERQYSSNPPESVSWYASLNVVLAFGGFIYAGQQELPTNNEALSPAYSVEDEVWEFIRNATSTFTDLLFQENNLMAIQAMIGMAFLLDSVADSHPSYILVSTATRMAHSMGLHRRLDHIELPLAEVEQRRRVFWILYVLDKGISLRSGRPSVIDDNDIGVNLPCPNHREGYDFSGLKRFNTFRSLVQLALLESRVSTQLYTSKSRTKSAVDRTKSMTHLLDELKLWRDALPVEIRPDHPIQCANEQFMSVTMMHLTFFHCIIAVHRVSLHYGPLEDQHPNESGSATHDQLLDGQISSSHLVCLDAARSIVRLMQLFNASNPPPRNNYTWLESYYPMCAFLILFANILQYPRDPNNICDLELMDVVTNYMSKATRYKNLPTDAISLTVCQELCKVARQSINEGGTAAPRVTERLLGTEQHLPGALPEADAPFLSMTRPIVTSNADVNGIITSANPNYNSTIDLEEPSYPPPFHDLQNLSPYSENHVMAQDDNGGMDDVQLQQNPFVPWSFQWEPMNLWPGDTPDF